MTLDADRLKALAAPGLPLAQTMKLVAEIEDGAPPAVASLAISAGSTIDLLGLFLRKHALLAGVRLSVRQGQFDDPVGDAERFAAEGVEHLLIAPFFDLLAPAFEAQAGQWSNDLIDAREAEIRARYRLAFQKGAGFRTIFLADFHRFGAALPGGDATDLILARFNVALREEAAAFANVRRIDMSALVAEVGRSAALDPRFYLRNRAPYSALLLDAWARQITAMSRNYGAQFRKALVLDCDNTLWGGVLGEDLVAGVKLGPHDYPGAVYWRAQQVFADLRREGVLLCLCSKNNPQDVEEMFAAHPDMVLTQADIILKKVNWREKVDNLREIAAELNIGLDSLVFLDDSDFECEAVRSQLPMVSVFQTPANLPAYLGVIEQIRSLFLAGGVSQESRDKTEQYRQRADALQSQQSFESHEAYLASLKMTVRVTRNDAAQVARISELSQKSNQFNLTTRRYAIGDLQALMASDDADVWSVEVADRFGKAGLTGVVVVRYGAKTADIENVLMSCRVLGRGVEFALWAPVLDAALARGCETLTAQFVASTKNAQVADYYDRLGLTHMGEVDGARRYAHAIEGLARPPSPWIQLVDD
ncbi:HAD-IIIC family phosphatase [Phenylobacterium sp.]|uniref:HAD-IIIC family phosphatase n=1 Tax=Phenylobacterium sp. TaxID=1871053 RepID=UPI0030F4B39C